MRTWWRSNNPGRIDGVFESQYKTVAVVAVVLAAAIWFTLGAAVALAFLVGGIASALTGYIGMNVAVA